MGYARRATEQDKEYDERLVRSGRRGVFSKRLTQEDLDAYLSMVGRVEKHRTMKEIHRDAKVYKDELHKAFHQG